MARIIRVRIHQADPAQRNAIQARFAALARRRDWRDQTPWLADAHSPELLPQLFFANAQETVVYESLEAGPLSAATFIKVKGDETDALALMFIFRYLSERF